MGYYGKILVIDDEIGIREGCRRALEPLGYAVETAASRQEGLKKIQLGNFDLVLLDVMLPDGQGIDLIEPIHAIDPKINCVIITGYATVDLAVRAIQLGAYDFISKPFTADVLRLTVEQGLEQRRLSVEMERLQQVEVQAEELARLDRFKSEFMLTITHELRSPVAGSQSLLRALLHNQAGELNAQQREILERVSRRMDTLMALVNDLLDLAAAKSAEQADELEILPLEPTLQTLARRFTAEAETGRVNLDFRPGATGLQVRASQDGLTKIFANLIGNAVKYTPAGGRVSLGLAEVRGQAVVTITDTGIGMPKEAIEHIGEEFYRAPNAKHTGITGTGLGMSIVKKLIERFSGQLEVQSQLGEGTTFTVRLPAVKENQE